MNKSRTAALILGLTVIVGPWIWALLAVGRDPKQGDAQGALTLATYSATILVPLGLVFIAFALWRRP